MVFVVPRGSHVGRLASCEVEEVVLAHVRVAVRVLLLRRDQHRTSSLASEAPGSTFLRLV